MKRTLTIATLALAALPLASCSQPPKSDIGLVDVPRLMANWPKYNNYNNQLASDQIALSRSRASNNDKQRQAQALEQRYVQMQTEVAGDVLEAARAVAADKHLRYVLTRQYVGYGGVDVTADVEKQLHITETSPKP